MVPQDLKYTKTHEWARLETDGTVTTGITGFAVEQLGDIVFLELPQVGQELDAAGAFGVIESVKAAVDLYSPIGGEVVATNIPLAQDFDTLSKDPFGGGWMAKIKPSNPGELDKLLSPADYQKFIESPEAKH
jgi:glycine cleavage system H protein